MPVYYICWISCILALSSYSDMSVFTVGITCSPRYITVFLFQFMSLHADRWCGWYGCRNVLVTTQVTTVWVNCFCHGSVYWALSIAIRLIDQMGFATAITLSLFIFGLMTCSTATTFFSHISCSGQSYCVPFVSLHMYFVVRVCWYVCSSLLLRILV